MNSSQFMDKQILGLSSSQNNDFFELLNPQDDHNRDKKDEIMPSYDFQPIRPINLDSGSKSWNTADTKTMNSGLKSSYSSIEPHESAKFTSEKERSAYDAATVAEIDRTMKKHTDNMLHVLEAVSARLSQLETRTHHLESSMDDLKITVGNNNGSTDGKLRQLENMLREVQTGVQVLRDKQEIAETQLHLAKLQASSKADQPTENTNTVQKDSLQQPTSLPSQSLQSLPAAPVQHPPSVPSLPPNALPPPQHNPPPVQVPAPLPPTHMPSVPSLPREQYYTPPSQPPESTPQQYQLPPPQQPQPPPQQPYQAPTQLLQYTPPSQPPPQHQPLGNMNTPQLQPPLSHHPEESSYMPPPPPTYPSSIRPQTAPTQLPAGSPPNQQFYGPNSHMYEPTSSRPSSGQMLYSAGYAPPSGPSYSDPYAHSGSPRYSSSSIKLPPHSSVSAPPSGGSYSRLPTAQALPHALPTATSVNSGSTSGGTGNRVPIDDVVEKVATMGFSREQVRATVRKLTENGQSVDLNVVLDKLMNDGEIQPQKGWFGR